MTLKKIAEEVGVSISTVSRVINQTGTKVASKDVQDKIWKVVRETGYVPNSAAQKLKKSKQRAVTNETQIIACLLARTAASLTDPFFSLLIRSVEEAAYRKNYIVKYLFTQVDLNLQDANPSFTNENVKGIVVLGRCSKQSLSIIKQFFKRIVIVSLNASDSSVDQIICKGEDIGYAAVEHLINNGHKKIGYIGEVNNESRFTGFKKCLLDHNLTFKEANISDVILSSGGGYKGAKSLLQKSSELTAIFCANDNTAVGAIHALKEEGVKIPEDVSVISVDNIEMAQYVSPGLTTVNIPVHEMGRVAVNVLIDRIEGGHRLPLNVSVPFSIVERESCVARA